MQPQTETPVNGGDEPTVTVRPVKPVMHWAELLKTPRWLLALAATDAGWLPEQQDDAVDELTQEEFEATITATKQGYEDACKANRGKRFCKALVHDSLLIACVVRRVTPGEEAVFIDKIRAAAEEDDKKAGEMVRSQFQGVIIYPSVAKVIAVRDLAPRSYVVLASKWQMSLGMEAEQSAKKR